MPYTARAHSTAAADACCISVTALGLLQVSCSSTQQGNLRHTGLQGGSAAALAHQGPSHHPRLCHTQTAMPEGPEVESARKLVANNVLGKRIIKVVAAEDEKVFGSVSPQAIQNALLGRSIVRACRKAKYLWFELSGVGPWPLLHFGMTGSVSIEGVGVAKYISTKVDTDIWPPKFWKLQLEFEGGQRMAFSDARRFGRVLLQADPLREEPVSKLGFDVIDDLPDAADFYKRFTAYQKPGSSLRIKALLLDQGFTAGVGNWVADEVLYQSHIHPEQPVADMTEQQVLDMHRALEHIMKVAVAANADADRFPPHWLFHYRWTGKRTTSVCGHPVEFVTVGSRTSAFVPSLQRITAGTGLSQQPKGKGSRAPRKRKGKDSSDPSGDVQEEPGASTSTCSPTLQPAAKRRAPAKHRSKANSDGSDETDTATELADE